MNVREYNGWTNYETWVTKLWIDNEEPSYRWFQQTAAQCYDNADPRYGNSRKEQATYDLSDTLKEIYEDSKPQLEGVWSDLLGAALSEVNWREIALSAYEDYDDWTEEEQEEHQQADEQL